MANLDINLTRDIQDWLNTPAAQRDIPKGAMMLLQLNRNRVLYNTIMTRPAKHLPKLEYELRKHLRIRLHNMSVADVVKLEKKVIPSAREALNMPPADLLPVADDRPEYKPAKGRRADHDSLPAEIRALWDKNLAVYQRIDALFAELKALNSAMPCDRFDTLVMLDEADRTYRKNLEAYDNYVAPEPVTGVSADSNAADDEAASDAAVVKKVNAARKLISKYRSRLAELAADDPKRENAVKAIQAAVNVVVGAGGDFAEKTRTELLELGIRFS